MQGKPYFQLDWSAAISRRRGASPEAVRELLLEAGRRGKTQVATTLQSEMGQPFFESLVEKGWLKLTGEISLPPTAEGVEIKALPLYDIDFDAIRAVDSAPEFVWNSIPDVDGVLKRPLPKAKHRVEPTAHLYLRDVALAGRQHVVLTLSELALQGVALFLG